MVFHWFISGAVVIGVSMFWLSSLSLSLLVVDNISGGVKVDGARGVLIRSLVSVVALNPRCSSLVKSFDKGELSIMAVVVKAVPVDVVLGGSNRISEFD